MVVGEGGRSTGVLLYVHMRGKAQAQNKLLKLLNSDDDIFCEVGVFSYDAIKTPPWVIMKSDIWYAGLVFER